eukprot:468270-Pyramimonas_sp.AAC.1
MAGAVVHREDHPLAVRNVPVGDCFDVGLGGHPLDCRIVSLLRLKLLTGRLGRLLVGALQGSLRRDDRRRGRLEP